MSVPSHVYRTPLALLTDLYELTMAHGYWKSGLTDHEAVFHLFFRSLPFNGGYCVACGLAYVVDLLNHFSFEESDLSYLTGLRGADDKPLFETAFLDCLGDLKLSCDVDALPEGALVFPQQPLVRVRGPLIESQLLESWLLNVVNFQTLIATKAARVCQAAGDEPVLEFGLRRAQGIDGALAVARAAYIGGCAATSNVLAGKLFDIPVKGTHAHSWVMAFDTEEQSFEAYAEAMPNNCVFLVDTYDTLDGVRRAVEAGKRLRERGYELGGVRLDSGDLAYLSIEARRILDAAGFDGAKIVASGDLDEHLIASLHQQGARIDVWGVGTKLVTAYDDPALGGVYKLTALRKPGRDWQHKIKLSEQMVKTTTPGMLQIRRFHDGKQFVADMVYDELNGVAADCTIVDPADATRRKRIPSDTPFTDMLVPILRGGNVVYRVPSVEDARRHTREQLGRLHPGIRRLVNPHRYPAGLERGLHDRKTRLIMKARDAGN
ncbi:MAG TPA: nicotinate phosphoribosyltransferase [Phycisphaerae bacterium]|nr:nicotinate phosphoribosyltransferase [Phycisphaerae bacterium]